MTYRFVVMSSSGEPAHAEDWACASDLEAVERAARNVPSFGAELWRDNRRLRAFARPLSATRPAPRPSA